MRLQDLRPSDIKKRVKYLLGREGKATIKHGRLENFDDFFAYVRFDDEAEIRAIDPRFMEFTDYDK